VDCEGPHIIVVVSYSDFLRLNLLINLLELRLQSRDLSLGWGVGVEDVSRMFRGMIKGGKR